jgi:hypothetical protein
VGVRAIEVCLRQTKGEACSEGPRFREIGPAYGTGIEKKRTRRKASGQGGEGVSKGGSKGKGEGSFERDGEEGGEGGGAAGSKGGGERGGRARALHKASEVLVEGVGSLMTQVARCCRPTPPEPIVGFVTRGNGVSVHRCDCLTFVRLFERHPERQIGTQWANR